MRKEKVEINNMDKETKKEKTNNKSNKRIVYTVIALFVIIIVYALIVSLNNVGLLNLNNTSNGKKAKLNYTETQQKTTDGVYITDVSEVVDNTMPAIVAITSKSLISSGNYGPSFFYNNDKQYKW